VTVTVTALPAETAESVEGIEVLGEPTGAAFTSLGPAAFVFTSPTISPRFPSNDPGAKMILPVLEAEGEGEAADEGKVTEAPLL
jgi:hypothetical protein